MVNLKLCLNKLVSYRENYHLKKESITLAIGQMIKSMVKGTVYMIQERHTKVVGLMAHAMEMGHRFKLFMMIH